MKSFLVLILCLCFAGNGSYAQNVKAEAPPFRITVGTKFTYHVVGGGKEYDFIVTVKSLEPQVAFDYEMTTPADKQGTVTIDPAAMKSAMALYNRFSGGPLALKKETGVFVSKALHDNAKKKNTVTIVVDGKAEKFTKLDGMDSKKNGNMYAKMIRSAGTKPVNLDGPILENARGTHIIRFQDTDYFPVITFMLLDTKTYLTDISQ